MTRLRAAGLCACLRRHLLSRVAFSSGQHSAEFVLLIGMTATVAVGMQLITRKALQFGVQAVNDRVLGHFSAAPAVVQEGGSTTLHWSVPGATSCTASVSVGASCAISGTLSGWSGVKSNEGEEPVGPIPRCGGTFRLHCTARDGDISLNTSVAIGSINSNSAQTMTEQGDSNFVRQTSVRGSSSGSSVNDIERIRRLAE